MHICAYVIMYFVFLDKCIKWRIVNKFFRGDRMKLLEHEKRFQNMELSPRFHAVSMEICRDYQRAFMRALSVATLLMDLGANESEIVLGMVCATGAWRSVEIKLSEAKAAGRIRLFLGVLEEDPEYDQFVLEDSLLTSTDRLIVDALFACRLREAIDYYRHMSKEPLGPEVDSLEDLINRYCVARDYLADTPLALNVSCYLRELASLLPRTPLMLRDECDVYLIEGNYPVLIEKIIDSLGWYRTKDSVGLYIAASKLDQNAQLLRLVGLIETNWSDLKIKKNPRLFSTLTWFQLPNNSLTPEQCHAREFCQKLFALAPNPFSFEAFMHQVQYF